MAFSALPDAFPVLRAGEILLREPVPTDASAWFARYSDPEVVFPTSGDVVSSPVETAGWIESMAAWFRAKDGIRWAIVPEAGGQAAGDIGFFNFDEQHRRAEIGYVLSKPVWGRGIATACARAVVAYGFEELGLNRVDATVMEGNEASLAVLRKLGFAREGLMREYKIARGEPRDFWMLGLLRRDWDARA